jgi:hypothetical protein
LDLAGFLILTTFIELPIHIYLLLSLFPTLRFLPFLIQTFQLSILPFEIFIDFFIIRSSLHERNLQFQMMMTSNRKQ